MANQSVTIYGGRSPPPPPPRPLSPPAQAGFEAVAGPGLGPDPVSYESKDE